MSLTGHYYTEILLACQALAKRFFHLFHLLAVQKRAPPQRSPCLTGNFLSSQSVSRQVLSASECLTTVFGMGTGGTIQASSPDILLNACTFKTIQKKLHFRWSMYNRATFFLKDTHLLHCVSRGVTDSHKSARHFVPSSLAR